MTVFTTRWSAGEMGNFRKNEIESMVRIHNFFEREGLGRGAEVGRSIVCFTGRPGISCSLASSYKTAQGCL
jgi:hypothetical protein